MPLPIAINEPADIGSTACLTCFDSTHGALDTPVSSIFALAEGRGEKARLPDEFTEDDTGDHAAELQQLRRSFRALSPANRRIAVELLKALERAQS